VICERLRLLIGANSRPQGERPALANRPAQLSLTRALPPAVHDHAGAGLGNLAHAAPAHAVRGRPVPGSVLPRRRREQRGHLPRMRRRAAQRVRARAAEGPTLLPLPLIPPQVSVLSFVCFLSPEGAL